MSIDPASSSLEHRALSGPTTQLGGIKLVRFTFRDNTKNFRSTQTRLA
jgi:hypothetical protein